MESKSFDWRNGHIPELHQHSELKLTVLRQYVVDYLRILVQGQLGKEEFKITLVDAFAGGGKYRNEAKGSPLILLEAVEEAEAIINTNRQKPLRIDAHFYLVEKETDAFSSLNEVLRESKWKNHIGKSIFLRHADFRDVCAEIIEATKKRHPRGGSRVIFFLDQCGWVQVPAGLIAHIARELHFKAEFILNFACDWLTSWMHDKDEFRQAYERLGLSTLVSLERLIQLKERTGSDWRYVVEAELGQAFKEATQSRFFCPFYIETTTGSNMGYWLVHMSPLLRARNAMMDVLWRQQTHCRHFGNAGLHMLAYRNEEPPDGYQTGMLLDMSTKTLAREKIAADLAREFPTLYPQGVVFEKLCADRIDNTIANPDLLGESVQLLVRHDEFAISGPGGGKKRAEGLEPKDFIQVNRQGRLCFPGFEIR
jgi:three-Cys-motif partner protein